MENTGFFPELAQIRKDSTELQQCIADTVKDLQKQGTSVNRPGMLLGLLRQKGTEAKGWRGLEFWWPVIVPQEDAVTAVFAAEAPAEDAVMAAAAPSTANIAPLAG